LIARLLFMIPVAARVLAGVRASDASALSGSARLFEKNERWASKVVFRPILDDEPDAADDPSHPPAGDRPWIAPA
jgi:hypothetical protein